MHTVIQWQDDQQVTAADLTAIGTFGRETIDFLTADAISTGVKFAGFPVSSTSATAVAIGAGRFYKGGQLFANADQGGVALDLINYLPSSAGNTKIVSIVAYGLPQDTDVEPRTYELDATTGTTEARQTAVQNERHATIVVNALAAEGPSPVPPPIAADQVEIARVTLSTTGIVAIAMVEANRLQTIDKLDARASGLEAFEATAGKRIATLGTDLANLAAAIVGLPSPTIFTQVVRELSQLAAQAKLPQNAINFHTDSLLTTPASASDPSNASYYARVDEGIRFPWAAQKIGILKLLNPLDPKVKAGSATGIMLPDYTEAARVDVIGNDGSFPITYKYQNTVATQVSLSRQVISFGPSRTVCQNNIWWQQGSYDPTTGIFSRDGEQYQATLTGKYAYPVDRKYNLQLVRVAQIFTSTMTDTYTAYSTVDVPVSGSAVYETFLNSQAGWLTSIDLPFTAVAAQGDVQLLLCGTTSSALPDLGNVLSVVTVPAASLKTWPATTNFPLKPTYLDAGTRYAWVAASVGNHSLAYVANNKYAQGAGGYADGDGGWTQPIDVTKDFAFRLNFAKFTSPICQVQIDPTPFALDNGLTDISLNYGAKIPDGCDLVWEIQVNGLWYPLRSYAGGATANPLLGLPAQVPVRVTYIGTTDLMPAIDMSQTQTLVSRPAGTFTHLTTPIQIGAASSTIKVELVVDAFDPAHHSVGCSLVVGGQTIAPSVAPGTPAADPADPTRFTLDYVFSLSAPTTSFVIKTTGTTDAVTLTYHVESRFDYEV